MTRIFIGAAAALFLGLGPSAASAATEASTDFGALVRQYEGGNLGYGATTKLGTATGAYQFTFDTLVSLGYIEKGQSLPKFGDDPWNGVRWTGKDGVFSRSQFLATPGAQDRAFQAFSARNWSSISSMVPVGKTVNGVPMTEGGALFAAHMMGAGGFNQWASCNFQSHCLDPKQAAANNMTLEQYQAHLMKRVAKGGGADPGNIQIAEGMGGEVGRITYRMTLMPWVGGPAAQFPAGVPSPRL
jgi:hypothetical protein